jgi:MerR family transcriptional regulator, thiopeptide resistance regulator
LESEKNIFHEPLDPDVTSCFILLSERKITLKRHLYHTGQFAQRASVTLRTLRYYDKVGLLSPSQHTESGYRLYAEEDLLTLQHILALKFLGFSLEDIKLCLRRGPKQLEEVLAQQRAMMQEKRAQLDAIVKAIEETEALLQAGRYDWESIARVIQVIQMEQKTDWVKKYFTDDQLQKMEELGQASYSEEARGKMQQFGEWTEEDQKRADEQWRYVATEAKRLAEAGADPAGEEAQALAHFKSELLRGFTQGDPEIEAGVKQFWQNFNALPQAEKPFDASPYSAGDAGTELLDKAMSLYQERQKSGSA